MSEYRELHWFHSKSDRVILQPEHPQGGCQTIPTLWGPVGGLAHAMSPMYFRMVPSSLYHRLVCSSVESWISKEFAALPLFLHSADWQIGRQFLTLQHDNAAPLAEARVGSVERLADMARQRHADAVLVAGDVFDAQTVSDRTIRRLFNALEGFDGPWLMISGNHDAALAESVWTRAQRLHAVPPNVHLLMQPEVFLLEHAGTVILPAPLTQRHTYGDLTAWFDGAQTPEGLFRVGMAHGSVQGLLAEDIDATNPIAPHRPDTARLDYLALGDWHGCRIVHPRMAYSGTPEPDRFKDNGAGQALWVELVEPGGNPKITPVSTAQYRWISWQSALQVHSDLDALLARLAGLGSADVVDLCVAGAIDLPMQRQLQQALGQAEARARHLQVDLSELRLLPSDDDLAGLQADGYLGEVLTELRSESGDERASPEERERAQDALALLAGLLLDRTQGKADA